MAARWKIAIGISFSAAAISIAVGFIVDADNFASNFVAELVGVFGSLGIAIWVIEDPVLSSQHKSEQLRQQVVFHEISDVTKAAYEISWLSLKSLGDWFASLLDPQVDMYGDERGDYLEFQILQELVFNKMKDDPEARLDEISEDDSRRIAADGRSFAERIENMVPEDLEVRAACRPLSDALHGLALHSRELRPHELARANDRFRQAGIIALEYIEVEKAATKILIESRDKYGIE